MIEECSAYEIVMIVHELHKRGYEHLRLFSGLSPSGGSWRWLVYPKVLMDDNLYCEHNHDSLPFECPHGSTGDDCPDPRRSMITADDFMKEYESYVTLAKGFDAEYVRWFDNIVNHVKNYDFPIAFAEYFNADQWKFTSGESLCYPPITPITIDSLSDEQMIAYVRCTFDDFSVRELNDVFSFEGIRPSIRQLANVIRQAISEKKGLINHVEFGSDKYYEYLDKDVVKKEKIEHGLRITLKTGEQIELLDEIELFAWDSYSDTSFL